MQAASPLADLRYISCARRRFTIPSNIEGHPRFSWGHSHSTARRSAFPVPSGNAPLGVSSLTGSHWDATEMVARTLMQEDHICLG